MFFLHVFFSILYQPCSVSFRRSDNVVVLISKCPEKSFDGKLEIRMDSMYLEEKFHIPSVSQSEDSSQRLATAFPVDLQGESRFSVKIFKQDILAQEYGFIWNDQTTRNVHYVTLGCLLAKIFKCSSKFRSQRFEEKPNCQSTNDILNHDIMPSGYLALKFNTDEEDLSVFIESKWQTEKISKTDFEFFYKSMCVIPIFDKNFLNIKIGKEDYLKLNIVNTEEPQTFSFQKLRIFFIPILGDVKRVLNFILYIENTAGQKDQLYLTDEIFINLLDQRYNQNYVASKRISEKISMGSWKIFKGTIISIPEVKWVTVQIQRHVPFKAREIDVIPVLGRRIKPSNKQILIYGSKSLFLATLLLSEKPITSLIESYYVKIKIPPNVLKLQFCIKSFEKICQFKDTDLSDSYQQIYVTLSPIEQLVLKSRNTEWTLSTKFHTDEKTTSTEIEGIHVEVNIRRMPMEGNKAKWSTEDERLMAKLPLMTRVENIRKKDDTL